MADPILVHLIIAYEKFDDVDTRFEPDRLLLKQALVHILSYLLLI